MTLRRLAMLLCMSVPLMACASAREAPEAGPSTVVPSPDSMVLRGVVLDDEGKAVAHAKVRVIGTDYNEGAKVDDEGRFEIVVRQGEYVSFIVTAPGAKYSGGTLHGLGARSSVWLEQPRVNARVHMTRGWNGWVEFPDDPALEAQRKLIEDIAAYTENLSARRRKQLPEPLPEGLLTSAKLARSHSQQETRDWFLSKINAERDPTRRRILLIHMFAFASQARGFDAEPEPELARELLESVEPDSRWWTVSPYSMWTVISEAGGLEEWEAYMERAVADSPSPFLEDSLLGQRALDAWVEDDHETVEAVIAKIDGCGGSFAHRVAAEYGARFGTMAIGKLMQDFEYTTVAEETVSPAALGDRPYLLYFWAPWCGACKQDFPALARLHEERKDLTIVGVSIAQPQAFREFNEERGPFGWKQVLIDADAEAQPTGQGHERFTNNAFPTWFLVGADGTILESSLRHMMSKPGHSELFEQVTAQLDGDPQRDLAP